MGLSTKAQVQSQGPGAHRNASLLCAWRSHWPGRWRERHGDSLLEKEWLAILAHTVVHHRAIPESLLIRFKTLRRACPLHRTDFPTVKAPPIRKSMEVLHSVLSITRGNHIDKGITEICISAEINWQVHKVVATGKALTMQ